MGECAKLKWNRRAKCMSQKEFADLAGVSVGTIAKLERDESAWLTVRPETQDKIYAHYTSMYSWQPDRPDKVIRDINDISVIDENEEVNVDEVIKEVEKVWPKKTEIIEPEKKKNIDKRDEKTLSLLTTIWTWLNESDSHEEFVENINMMKNIIDHY
jgi:transcriptional regulator with XRE-family HTH domain